MDMLQVSRVVLILSLIGAVCIIYGAIVRTAGSGTAFFMVWIALGFLCMGGAWLIGSGLIRQLPGWVRIGLAGGILAGCVLVTVITAMILTEFHGRQEEEVDYILVLGAQMRKDGPSKSLRFRLDKAYDWLSAHPDCLCILSGGQGANEPVTEALGMKTYLCSRGIGPERLILEDASRNTIENVRNSMRLFDPERDRIGIITNNFHMFRSLRIAKKQGIRHVTGIPAGSDPFFLPNNIFRENIGVIKDVLAGNM